MLLSVALDALGDDGEAERMGHLDDGAHDGRVAALVDDAGDERAVDLERGEWKAREVGEARVAGAEVVDGDAQARVAERAQDARRVLGVVHQLALGDLELDQRRIDPRAIDDGADAHVEVELAELPRRQVHRDRQQLGPRGLPGAQVRARLAQHPFADRHDQSALLEDRDEVRRRDDAAGRVVPTQQRLGAARPLGLQVEFRLVHQAELAALERPAKLCAEERAGAGALVDLGGEELEAVAAGLLGSIHGGIGGAQQRFDVLAVGREKRDADARADEELVAADIDRGAQPLDQLLRYECRVLGAHHVGEHDGELVAGNARHGIAGAHAGLQAARRLLQQLIAAGMAERVVHQLEFVEIHEQHAELRAVTARLHDHLGEAVGEQRPVGQPRQRVELREESEPAFALDALQAGREHARGRGEETGLVVAEGRRAWGQRAERTARAVLAVNRRELRRLARRPGEGQLAAPAAALLERFGKGAACRVERRRARMVGGHALDAAHQQLTPVGRALEVRDAAAAQAFEYRAHRLGDQLVGVALGERLLAEAGDLFLVALVGRPPLLVVLAAGHVLEHRDLVERLAGRTARERHGDARPGDRAVLAQVALFEARARALRTAARLVGLLAILGVRDVAHRAADQLVFVIAEHFAEARVDAQEDAVEADMRDARCGEVERLPEPPLALAQRALGGDALQHLPHLRADEADRFDQALIGGAHLLAREAEYADGAALGDHREDERPAGESRAGRHAARARILAGVGQPERLAALPHVAGQAFAAAIDPGARAREERLDARVVAPPGFQAAQYARRFVHAEESPAGPVLGLADRADHRAQRARGVFRDGQRARHRLLEHAQLLGTLARRDVLSDAAITAKDAGLVEDRRAARAHPHLAALDDAAKLEVVERPVRLHRRDVPRPVGGAHVDVVDVPEPPAEQAVAVEPVVVQGVLASERGEAQCRVLLPVDVGDQLREPAKARLALAQRAHGGGLQRGKPHHAPQPAPVHAALGDEVVGAVVERL